MKQRIRSRMTSRLAALVVSAFLVALMAAPASAHSGYLSCSPSYQPTTNSASSSYGTHTHTWRGGSLSQYTSYLSFQWTNTPKSGWWTAGATVTHSGWATCT